MPTKIEKDSITGRETTGHEWDGIKELNTPLPKWWLWVFYATIAFSVLWMILYPALPIPGATGLTGWTARGALPAQLEAARAAQAPILSRIAELEPEAIAADPQLRAVAMAGGRAAFATNCAGCHGAGGEGRPGGYPALGDDHWIWGGSFEAIRFTIRHGIRNQEDAEARIGAPMQAYLTTGQLSRAQIQDLVQHILSYTGRATDRAGAERGAALYAEQCASCHGERGEGNRDLGAPPLNTRIFVYGGDAATLFASIAYGRAGVMPPWAGRLDAATINMLTVYVHALGGGERE
ncbi:MAG: cytochrome-c oxidase, cbb3-type subunit III [Acetobacteraceae bacterium]|nr:cytochrome-c oxidase, cbb3-type subunit III [Acetobacteraceae bacterium]MCX7685804.1 cytochrome-c oxidase, cbb3-type subunit III [Acetobacteraceae bacterium]